VGGGGGGGVEKRGRRGARGRGLGERNRRESSGGGRGGSGRWRGEEKARWGVVCAEKRRECSWLSRWTTQAQSGLKVRAENWASGFVNLPRSGSFKGPAVGEYTCCFRNLP